MKFPTDRAIVLNVIGKAFSLLGDSNMILFKLKSHGVF